MISASLKRAASHNGVAPMKALWKKKSSESRRAVVAARSGALTSAP
jgi:hypothetical protein